MPNRLTQLADRQKLEAQTLDARYLRQLVEAYGLMYDRLGGDIDALVLAINELEDVSFSKVEKSPQYKRLIRRAQVELDKFSVFLETTIETAALASITLGLQHSAALVNTVAPGFTSLEPAVMRPLLKYLDPDGGLYARLKLLTGSQVDYVVQTIIDGVGSGYNPRKIGRLIQDAFGRGLTDAVRNTRTVQLWSYRDSARANYTASGVVQGWVWYAKLDGDTCMSCVSQHGSIHGLNEMLDDHDNGRCAPLPYMEKFGNPVEQGGQAWFDSLDEAQQKKMMGKGKYEAWKEGRFEFAQLSRQHPDDRYGTMRTEASLKHLIGDEEDV